MAKLFCQRAVRAAGRGLWRQGGSGGTRHSLWMLLGLLLKVLSGDRELALHEASAPSVPRGGLRSLAVDVPASRAPGGACWCLLQVGGGFVALRGHAAVGRRKRGARFPLVLAMEETGIHQACNVQGLATSSLTQMGVSAIVRVSSPHCKHVTIKSSVNSQYLGSVLLLVTSCSFQIYKTIEQADPSDTDELQA